MYHVPGNCRIICSFQKRCDGNIVSLKTVFVAKSDPESDSKATCLEMLREFEPYKANILSVLQA